ncbi:MAG: hypothetical protein SFX18_03995 [Pirellulales bacterium]|nr:hypothetical protein [Pirellulales bacterium]
MVSESICLNILQFARGRTLTLTTTMHVSDPPSEQNSRHKDAFTDADLYRYLLTRYPMAEIDAAICWLQYSHYIGESSATIRGPFWKQLTQKGRDAADAGGLPDDDRSLLYQEQQPHQVFVAHQFNADDTALVSYIRDRVLTPAGFELVDGRAEGLEDFRTSILTKIKRARFFICLVTKRIELSSGTFASSVWLYQETGVAVAFGKQPLLLVEDSIDTQYVGELQSIYEYIVFNRSNHPQVFDKILPRLIADLKAYSIPLPQIRT